jgi:uncharacterized membrane protein HdeD (DUF308 family)
MTGMCIMASNEPLQAREFRSAVTAAIHRHWGLFLLEGIVLIVLGTLAILVPAVASLAATLFFGWILLFSGLVGLFATLRARHAPGFGWSLFSAITGILAGAVLLWMPVQGTLSLTTVLIVFLIVEGVVSIFYALDHRKSSTGRWGWMLASGVIDVFLGIILLAGLPGTAMWALGLIVGINMLFGGWSLVLIALHARSDVSGTPTQSGTAR